MVHDTLRTRRTEGWHGRAPTSTDTVACLDYFQIDPQSDLEEGGIAIGRLTKFLKRCTRVSSFLTHRATMNEIMQDTRARNLQHLSCHHLLGSRTRRGFRQSPTFCRVAKRISLAPRRVQGTAGFVLCIVRTLQGLIWKVNRTILPRSSHLLPPFIAQTIKPQAQVMHLYQSYHLHKTLLLLGNRDKIVSQASWISDDSPPTSIRDMRREIRRYRRLRPSR